jgi:hypothetical protein
MDSDLKSYKKLWPLQVINLNKKIEFIKQTKETNGRSGIEITGPKIETF